MEPSALPLVLATASMGEPGERFGLDRIRMQKAVFLLVQRGAPAWRSLYVFRPYNWGPYSSDLAQDIDRLVGQGLLEAASPAGSRYPRYRATALGEAAASAVISQFGSTEREFLRSVRSYVTRKSFTDLLREVYAAYPSFASASLFEG